MEEAPVTAATGALGPVIAKLAALLGSEYKLRWRTRRDVKFIRSKLKPVHSILWNIWEMEQLDEASMALKMEALDLADDVEDAIFDFILSMERSGSNKRPVQTKIKASPFRAFKKRASDVSARCRSKWKERKQPFSSLLSCGKLATNDSSTSKPRGYPFKRRDPLELVGMDGPRDKLIQYLVGEGEDTQVHLQLKTATILGTAGMGKTTLADLVYQAVGDKFQSRAFVSVTRPGGNMREVLATILQQVTANSSVPLAATQASKEEDLIDIISTFLKDKRYLVIIDDIWNSREWQMIMKSLPENTLGSRIVRTTRIDDVAQTWKKWLAAPDDPFYERPDDMFHKKLQQVSGKEWFYEIGEKNIVSQMVAVKADMVAEVFDYEHPIVHMCGGMPLAVHCMLSAVAEEREKQGPLAKTCDVQDEIVKHVMQNGIQNTPGFEPLVESLRLGYDSLPHHMLRTCLLHCSIYPEDHIFEKVDLVRQWVSEGFACTEEEANGYFEELANRRLILRKSEHGSDLTMHPMMLNFLRWKSREANFFTYSSEITPSHNTCRIRRLCVDGWPYIDAAADTLSALDWNHIRSLIVYEGIERVPFENLQGLRLLDLSRCRFLRDRDLKGICGLFRLRHLLGFSIPSKIVNLQYLETFQASGQEWAPLYGLIEALQQLKTLDVSGNGMEEVPKNIVALQQLETLIIRDTDIKEVPREVGELRQLKTLEISNSYITELPKEIGKLLLLKTLDINHTRITELPREIGKLQQLRILNISGTLIAVLPKEIRKLQQLERLLMSGSCVHKVPREIGALKELKSLELDDCVVELPLEVCTSLVELPDCIHQALNKRGLVSELAREMLFFQKSRNSADRGGLVVNAKQMHIPPWIREHFNDISLLDIRICKLEEQGLKVLREMPRLRDLTLRFEVVPREPVVISSQGFTMLCRLTIDSRVPRVTFQEGAMPTLDVLTFRFQFYAGSPNKDPVGVNHLKRLEMIFFECNEDWYEGGDSPCIRAMIDVVWKEAREIPFLSHFLVCGRQGRDPPSPPPHEMGQHSEIEEEERSSGVDEIEEHIHA